MLSWFRKIKSARQRMLVEDALKHLYRCDRERVLSTTESVGETLGVSSRRADVLWHQLQAQGLVEISDEHRVHITLAGEQLALQVIRAHRLWEKYLVDEARVPLADVHTMADRREHKRNPEAMSELDASMGYPTTDPHGDPIPTAEGVLSQIDSVPLTHWPIDQSGMIVHLEDEPVAIFAQIAAIGLFPGQRVKVIESTAERIVFTDHQATHVLAPIVAANVFLSASEPMDTQRLLPRLTSLELGASAKVRGLDRTLQGYTRRRLLDLGLTNGADITAEYRSFLGDPVAYRVRGSLIALRQDQAAHVLISTNQDEDQSQDQSQDQSREQDHV